MNPSIPSYESHVIQSDLRAIVDTVSMADKANEAMGEFIASAKGAVEIYRLKMARASMVLGTAPAPCSTMTVIEDELLKLSQYDLGTNWRKIKEAQQCCADLGHGTASDFGHMQSVTRWCSLCGGTIPPALAQKAAWDLAEAAILVAEGMDQESETDLV